MGLSVTYQKEKEEVNVSCFELFSTKIWVKKLDIDIPSLLNILSHPEGGHLEGFTHFVHDGLSKAIKDNIPTYEDIELPETYLQYWANYNLPGDYNRKHHHSDTIFLLSGVVYLKVPPNSGRISFHDPRGSVVESIADYKYYGYEPEVFIDPEPGMVVYFPSWLEHEVEKNESDEDRVSIAFNIISKDELDRYRNMENWCEQNAIATRYNGNTEYYTAG